MPLDEQFITQENGQRKFGGPPPGWQGPLPGRGTEIFVGKLPRRCDEQQLWTLVNEPAPVFEMRVMIDFTGDNRGFAFVVYGTKEDAKLAVEQLNNREIAPNRKIGCVPSVDNRRLFVGNIPRDRPCDVVKAELTTLVDGVVDVITYPSASDKQKNRGFAFIEFDTHRQAALARQKLTREKATVWSQQLCIDWAEPEPEVDDQTMSQVRILYVRNLHLQTDEASMRSAFEAAAPAGSIEKVKKIKDFGFVHFATRDAANQARQKMHGAILDGAVLEVIWSKPPDKSVMKVVRESMKAQGKGPAKALATPYSTLPPTPNGMQAPTTPAEWFAAGTPIIDASRVTSSIAASTAPLQHNSDKMLSRLAKGAAGTRGVGFQTYVNNQVKRNRRHIASGADAAMPMPGGQLTLQIPGMPVNQAHLGAIDPTIGTLYLQQCAQLGLDPQLILFQQALAAQQMASNSIVVTPTSPAEPKTDGVEMLSNYCKTRALGEPVYELLTVPSQSMDGAEPSTILCIYKVTIPTLSVTLGAIMPDKASTTAAEAKHYAALYSLIRIEEHLAQLAYQEQNRQLLLLQQNQMLFATGGIMSTPTTVASSSQQLPAAPPLFMPMSG